MAGLRARVGSRVKVGSRVMAGLRVKVDPTPRVGSKVMAGLPRVPPYCLEEASYESTSSSGKLLSILHV